MEDRVDVESAPPFFGGNDIDTSATDNSFTDRSRSTVSSSVCSSAPISPVLHIARWNDGRQKTASHESIVRFHPQYRPVVWTKDSAERFVIAFALSQRPDPRMDLIRTFYVLENAPQLQKQFAMLLALYVYGGLYVHNAAIATRSVDLSQPGDNRVYVSESDGLWVAAGKNNLAIGTALEQFSKAVQDKRSSNVDSPWADLRTQSNESVVQILDKTGPLRFESSNFSNVGVKTDMQPKQQSNVKKGVFESLAAFISPPAASTGNTAEEQSGPDGTNSSGSRNASSSEVTWWSRIAVGLLAIFVIGAMIVGLFRRFKVDRVAQNAIKSVTGNVQGWVDKRLQDWQKTMPLTNNA